MSRTTKRKALAAGATGLAALGTAIHMGVVSPLHLPVRPRPDKIRVACVGDSLTYGCFVPGQPRYHYPAQLGRMLGAHYQVANFGYTNHTAQREGDYPYTARRLYRKSLDFAPEVVILMLGSNDSKAHNWDPARYEEDLTALVESYQSLTTQPTVYLMLPPPAYPRLGRVLWKIRPEVIEQEILPIIRRVAAAKGTQLIDLHTPFVDHPELFIEGVHTNRQGATRMAEIVYQAMSKSAENF